MFLLDSFREFLAYIVRYCYFVHQGVRQNVHFILFLGKNCPFRYDLGMLQVTTDGLALSFIRPFACPNVLPDLHSCHLVIPNK
uniref:Uncharacterized protein n=1 Tax=Arundo donax TaxID=35708 RepID=A0A0A9A5D3_ARUDO